MTVVRNRVRMGGSERFWVGKYDGGGGLSEKVMFFFFKLNEKNQKGKKERFCGR